MASRDFDPYHEWLGIPASEQPPHHYRLLGIPAFEESPKAIQNAADRQMVYLRTFQIGQHSALSQKLLNEVASAKVCLLNPEKKAAYDEQLQRLLQPHAVAPPPASDPLPSPTLDEILDTASPTPVRGVPRPRKNVPQKSLGPVITTVVVASVAVLALVLWWSIGGGERPKLATATKVEHAEPQRPAVPSQGAPKASLPPKVVDAKTPTPTARPELPPEELPTPQEEPKAQPVTQQEENVESPQPVKTLSDDSPKTDPAETKDEKENTTTTTSDQRQAVPDETALKQASVLVKDLYKDEYAQAKTVSQKQALAQKILERAKQTQGDAAGQYALLRLAHDVAITAHDAALAFETAEETARLYKVDAAEMKAAAVSRLLKAPQTPAESRATVEHVGSQCWPSGVIPPPVTNRCTWG